MAESAGFVLLGVRLLCVALVALQAKAGPLQVAAVEVTGTHRYTQAEVVRVSGLQTGTTVGTADLDAATQRMAATGLFKQVNYRYLTAAGKTTVTFTIEEADWTMPVILDNFIWFKDDEIVAALRQRIPSFDGTAPILSGFSDLVTRELQALLQSKQIPGTVEFLPPAHLDTGVIEAFIFRVRNPEPGVCAVHFTGATAVKEAELAERLAVDKTEYSRSYILNTSRGTRSIRVLTS